LRIESDLTSTPQPMTPPEEMIAVGTAVATVLEVLNQVMITQQRATMELVTTTVQALEALAPPQAPQDETTAAYEEENPGAGESTPEEADPAPAEAKPVPLPEARSQALTEVYQSAAHALGVAFYNAAAEQQQLAATSQAILVRSANLLLTLATAEVAKRTGLKPGP